MEYPEDPSYDAFPTLILTGVEDKSGEHQGASDTDTAESVTPVTAPEESADVVIATDLTELMMGPDPWYGRSPGPGHMWTVAQNIASTTLNMWLSFSPSRSIQEPLDQYPSQDSIQRSTTPVFGHEGEPIPAERGLQSHCAPPPAASAGPIGPQAATDSGMEPNWRPVMRPLMRGTRESVPHSSQCGSICPSPDEQIAGQAPQGGVTDSHHAPDQVVAYYYETRRALVRCYNNVSSDVSPWPQLRFVHSGVENAAVDNLTLLIQQMDQEDADVGRQMGTTTEAPVRLAKGSVSRETPTLHAPTAHAGSKGSQAVL